MDEPFGALDPILRKQLQEEFARIKEELGKTIVFVTHDVEEAFRLGDRIAIMNEGRLVQVGEPFGALDPILRKQLQEEFARIKEELGKQSFLLLMMLKRPSGLGTELQ